MIIGFLLLSYGLGSLPTALIVGKLFFGVDIRDHGSKNPGATNTLRVFGKGAALIVLVFDVGKGAVAAYLPQHFNLPLEPLYFGFLAVAGHCFPIFAGFKGGKAIATTAGALFIADPSLFVVAYAAFFLMILLSKYVFVGSLSVGVSLLVYSLLSSKQDLEILFLAFLLLLIYLHRSNLRNMILGIEPKINDKSILQDRIPPKKA